MLGYMIEGVGPVNAMEDPRTRRLASSGPWMAQPHPNGCVITWKTEDGSPRPMASFGPGRSIGDGMTWLPPKKLPQPGDLLKKALVGRDDLHDVEIETPEGSHTIKILPAYLSPRVILSGDQLGDFATAYGRKARLLLERFNAEPDVKMSAIARELYDVCRYAIMHSVRSTEELIEDCGWLNEDSAWAIWWAVIRVPKESPASVSAPSA